MVHLEARARAHRTKGFKMDYQMDEKICKRLRQLGIELAMAEYDYEKIYKSLAPAHRKVGRIKNKIETLKRTARILSEQQ